MSKIPEDKAARIKAAMKIRDVVENDLGVTLIKKGKDYFGLCPFHDDRNPTNFVVNEDKNICSCFACGYKGLDPIEAMKIGLKWDYNRIMRHLAARYDILIDDEPVPVVKKAEPRKPAPPKSKMYWPLSITSESVKYRQQNGDNLTRYMEGLPLTKADLNRLKRALELYLVGTSGKNYTKGRTIWWYVNEDANVCTGKIMAYKPDGHRDKTTYPTWTHSMLESAGLFDSSKFETYKTMFGMHLIDIFPAARICICESEKTAVFMSAFDNMENRLWLATGGISNLNMQLLKPLFDRKREIEVYPDIDGYDNWSLQVGKIDYDLIWVSNRVRNNWKPADGEKADVMDITIRMLTERPETESETAHRLLGLKEENLAITKLITGLGLEVDGCTQGSYEAETERCNR